MTFPGNPGRTARRTPVTAAAYGPARRHVLYPYRWAIVALIGLTLVALAMTASRPDGTPPPDGWIQVPCEPWPGGEGPCYAPPQQLTPKPPQCGQPGQLPCYTPPAARRSPATTRPAGGAAWPR